MNPDLLPRLRIARDEVDEVRRLVENNYKKNAPIRLLAVTASEAVRRLVAVVEEEEPCRS